MPLFAVNLPQVFPFYCKVWLFLLQVYRSPPLLPQICGKYAPFCRKFDTSLSLFTTSLPKVFFFYHKSTANMSILIAKFVPFCRKFIACFFQPQVYHNFLFGVNLPQLCLFLLCCLPLSVVNLPQVLPFCDKVCPFLPQVYRNFIPFYHTFAPNMPFSTAKSVFFTTRLQQVYFFLSQICPKSATSLPQVYPFLP